MVTMKSYVRVEGRSAHATHSTACGFHRNAPSRWHRTPANPCDISNKHVQPVTRNVYPSMAAWQGWSFISSIAAGFGAHLEGSERDTLLPSRHAPHNRHFAQTFWKGRDGMGWDGRGWAIMISYNHGLLDVQLEHP